MAVPWKYFDKFGDISEKYLPNIGEGETKASQIVTAVCKLVYKWYNDGDVFDNTGWLDGWCNDISTFANWLMWYTDAGEILEGIWECNTSGDYEDLLKDLADKLFVEEDLEKADKEPKVGSVYTCTGCFRFVVNDDDEDDY